MQTGRDDGRGDATTIDPRDGDLIALVRVPDLDWIPRSASGKKLDKSTAIRWALDGKIGADGERHRLPAVRVGRTLYTTETALVAWIAATSPQIDRPPAAPVAGRDRAREMREKAGIAGSRRRVSLVAAGH